MKRAEHLHKYTQLQEEIRRLETVFFLKMAAAAPPPTWEPATGSLQGMYIRQYNMNCITGHKIAVDFGQNFTTLGQRFFDRWRKCDKTSIIKFTTDNTMTTNIQIGGRFYPATISLVNGMSPLKIGKDFFILYN